MNLRLRLLAWARNHAVAYPPDFVVGDRQLERWWLIPRNSFFNIYLHRFNGSDEDRALHDHMYINLSWLLGPGGYNEITFRDDRRRYGPTRVRYRMAGGLVLRRPATAHRIALPDDVPVYTLFVTGPRVRRWGFWCPWGWRHWKDFVSDDNRGVIGRGCE